MATGSPLKSLFYCRLVSPDTGRRRAASLPVTDPWLLPALPGPAGPRARGGLLRSLHEFRLALRLAGCQAPLPPPGPGAWRGSAHWHFGGPAAAAVALPGRGSPRPGSTSNIAGSSADAFIFRPRANLILTRCIFAFSVARPTPRSLFWAIRTRLPQALAGLPVTITT